MIPRNRVLSSRKKGAFIIRDDDVNYFTQPWMLDELYREAWKQGFKVSFAVIPYVQATSYPFIPRSSWSTRKFFKISENQELLHFLRDKILDGQADIVQHGFSHKRHDGKPEFYVKDFKLVNETLRMGNRILREAFGRKIKVFTAPHEKISKATWQSLSQNEMCLCRKFTLGRFLATVPILDLKFRRILKVASRHPNPFKLIPDTIVDLADVLVIQWDALLSKYVHPQKQLENAKQSFNKRFRREEAFVLLHHHWEYFHDQELCQINRDLLSCFNSLLRFVSSTEVWKTTLSDLLRTIQPQY